MREMRIAILGAGNLGTCIASGLVESGRFSPENISLTRRNTHLLDPMKARGFVVQKDNAEAVRNSTVIIVAVEPHQIDGLLEEIGPHLTPGRHVVISTVTGASIAQIAEQIGRGVAVVRAMPNTAIGVRESMTCLASDGADAAALDVAKSIFEAVGRTLVIAAQTAKGAASLLTMGSHPEHEIDRVTTPSGCTIAGLNQMEHAGFSSAMIKGITVSAEKAAKLYANSGD